MFSCESGLNGNYTHWSHPNGGRDIFKWNTKSCPRLTTPRPSRFPSVASIVVLSSLFWTEQLLSVCLCFSVCYAFVHKGILLYESLWRWLCKFNMFSSLHPVITQVPTCHLAYASSCLFFLLLVPSFSSCLPLFPSLVDPSWPFWSLLFPLCSY